MIDRDFLVSEMKHQLSFVLGEARRKPEVDRNEQWTLRVERAADAILDRLAEHDREVRAAERERIYREVRGIPAWGTLEEREDHGGFDVPGQNARALVLAAIRTEPDDAAPGGAS